MQSENCQQRRRLATAGMPDSVRKYVSGFSSIAGFSTFLMSSSSSDVGSCMALVAGGAGTAFVAYLTEHRLNVFPLQHIRLHREDGCAHVRGCTNEQRNEEMMMMMM